MIITATRINITLSDSDYEELKQVAKESGMDMSEFTRNALRLMKHVQTEKKKGRRLYFGKDDKFEVEILLP